MTRGEGGRLRLPSAGLSPAILRQFAWRTTAPRRTRRNPPLPEPGSDARRRDARRSSANQPSSPRAATPVVLSVSCPSPWDFSVRDEIAPGPGRIRDFRHGLLAIDSDRNADPPLVVGRRPLRSRSSARISGYSAAWAGFTACSTARRRSSMPRRSVRMSRRSSRTRTRSSRPSARMPPICLLKPIAIAMRVPRIHWASRLGMTNSVPHDCSEQRSRRTAHGSPHRTEAETPASDTGTTTICAAFPQGMALDPPDDRSRGNGPSERPGRNTTSAAAQHFDHDPGRSRLRDRPRPAAGDRAGRHRAGRRTRGDPRERRRGTERMWCPGGAERTKGGGEGVVGVSASALGSRGVGGGVRLCGRCEFPPVVRCCGDAMSGVKYPRRTDT